MVPLRASVIALDHGLRPIPVANADYVPRPSRGKVTNVRFVPDSLPSADRMVRTHL